MGSGKLLAVWTAIFVNKNESNALWAECADALKQAEQLYVGYNEILYKHESLFILAIDICTYAILTPRVAPRCDAQPG
jgi:hypothetical protein